MTNKAKIYLKNIQEADTEKKLVGIEIAFKQDMTISCDDLGNLCRAAEDKRYSLRNNEETQKLKHILFFRTKAEMDAYHDMAASRNIYNIGGNYFATFSSFFMIEKMNNAESKQHTINTLHTIHNCISPHK